MAQRDRYELAEGREKRAVVTRDVPGDWFLDPADPEAGTRYSSNLDPVSYTHLRAHETS